jgi:uncharacterized protein (TIGR00661 family)
MATGSVLVAPLNWGLGHVTRCIPIIEALLRQGYTPIIASDGVALQLLKKEFPTLKTYELKDLNIKYPKKGIWFNFKMLFQLLKFLNNTIEEQKFLKKIIEKEHLVGIIADNRLGFYHKSIPCVIISHQLNVLSGTTTRFTSSLHRFFIKKYNECWVPDHEDEPNLSGKLGHLSKPDFRIKYLGTLSRFQKQKQGVIYDILILLSGPEPQRTLLEEKIYKEFSRFKGKVVLVRGKIEDAQKINKLENITVYNYLKAQALEKIIQQSDLVVARSGYTTLMDLAKLDKKAFFIPTPGQTEQEYLAKRLEKIGIAPYCKQEKFNVEELKRVEAFKGLGSLYRSGGFSSADIFRLFDGK